jgi:hypothetical protein
MGGLMLTIRDAQMQIFRDAGLRGFPAELARYIRKTQPENTRSVPSATLRVRVEYGIAQAGGYGFRELRPLAAFVSLMFSVGPGFHQHPSFRAVLSDRSIPPERRLQRLTDISAWSWRSVRDNGEAAWKIALRGSASGSGN